MIDLRCGRWQDVLADVEMVDCVCTDPPYGERTHVGNDRMDEIPTARRVLAYARWAPNDVREFIAAWAPRTRAWMVSMTSDDLVPVYREAYAAAGRFDFAPVAVVAPRVRLGGDGPASATVYLMVARPRRREFLSWGALPGWYGAGIDRDGVIGGKPLSLMRAIIRDYTRPGDLVVDPCAGGATTLLAAAIEGRRAIGAEMDPETYRKAMARIQGGYSAETARSGEQLGLLAGGPK